MRKSTEPNYLVVVTVYYDATLATCSGHRDPLGFYLIMTEITQFHL